MMRKPSSRWLQILCSLTLALNSVLAHAQEAPKACYEELVRQCEGLNTAYKTPLAATYVAEKSTAQRTLGESQRLGAAGERGVVASNLCASLESQCSQFCQDPQEQRTCQQKITFAVSRMRAEASGFTSSGIDMGTVAGLLAAGAGVAGVAMIAAGSNKSSTPQTQYQQPQPQPQASGALQLDGSLQCQMADAHKYADCNNYLVGVCTPNPATQTIAQQTPVTGAVIQTPSGASTQVNCTEFTARYCSSTVEPPTGMGYHLPNGVVTQVNMAGKGEGYSTPYCQKAWCNADGAHAACPLCQQLNSGGCTADPTTCLAASTSSASSCQGFPQGTPGASGATAVAQIPSVPSGAGSAPATGFTAPPNVAGQVGQASLSSELIAPGGVIVQRQAASSTVVAGPASDIVGTNGPSVFSTSSSVMQQRCQGGRLNCP